MTVFEQKKGRAILSYASALLLGAFLLYGAQTAWTWIAPCHDTYDLLNHALRCQNLLDQGEWDYEPLRNALLAKKNELKTSKHISHVSVYFRDLNHGPRFGIGEYDKFQPASLLKLPVLIAFLHEADRDPSVLDKTLSYTGTLNININVEQSEETIRPDTPYTIRELLEKMIVYSDNFSYTLLTRELNATPPITAYYTFRDLGVLSMMMAPKADYVSIQSYANLFAVLYNTGYLSKEMSQFALHLLSKATFKDGLAGGVPDSVRVAHKFGHRILADEDSQLHDCGIVYHPVTPYVLCIMTSGPDFEQEKSAIAELSRIVYENIAELHVKKN